MRSVRIAFALLVLVAGLIFLPLPIPLGIPLISLALILLIRESKFTKRSVRILRQRVGIINRWLTWLEAHGPRHAAATLRKTRPRILRRRNKGPAALPAQTV